jgi:hypothetical protein
MMDCEGESSLLRERLPVTVCQIMNRKSFEALDPKSLDALDAEDSRLRSLSLTVTGCDALSLP